MERFDLTWSDTPPEFTGKMYWRSWDWPGLADSVERLQSRQAVLNTACSRINK